MMAPRSRWDRRKERTKASRMRANLTQANLTQANLTQANLTQANLTQANLTQANLTQQKAEPKSDGCPVPHSRWRRAASFLLAGALHPDHLLLHSRSHGYRCLPCLPGAHLRFS